MKLQDLEQYVNEKAQDGLTKIDFGVELIDNVFYVAKTKETYVFLDESDADKAIDEARQLRGFVGCDKKFKAGKISKKTGEEITPDTYVAVIKLNH